MFEAGYLPHRGAFAGPRRKAGRAALAAALLTLGVLQPQPAFAQKPSSAGPGASDHAARNEYVVAFGGGISHFPAAYDPESARAVRIAVRQSRAAEAAVRAAGGKIVYRFRAALIGFIVQLPRGGIDKVKTLPGVWRIDRSKEYRLEPPEAVLPYQPQPQPQPQPEPEPPRFFALAGPSAPSLSWGLDRIDQRVGTDGSFHVDQTSSKVRVYVIDSGIKKVTSQFGSRLETGKSVVPGSAKNDCSGHGTHVAGTIGSKSYGVANQVGLYPVRVVTCDGLLTTATMLRGVDWVLSHYVSKKKPFPAVANMSLVAEPTPTLDQAVRNSRKSGLTYVVAAGNDGVDACEVSPAGVTEAITVGNVAPRTDTISSSSNTGPCVDIFAPGVGILSVGIGTQEGVPDNGTSMAAAHVSGVAALYLQTHPGADPDAVWNAILAAANIKPNSYGWVGVQGVDSTTPDRMLYWKRKTP